jgi:hypothetical protein
MTTPDLESLTSLDWTEYACNCPCHPQGCGNRATHVVSIHALHRCNEPGLTFGDRVEFRCVECLLRLQAEVHFRLKDINRWGIGECGTCGAPMTRMTDLVRDWSELA